MDAVNRLRRSLIEAGVWTFAAAQFGIIRRAAAHSSSVTPPLVPTGEPIQQNAFGALKRIEAGTLAIGYVDAGPVAGPVAILLHDWPYAIHSYADVVPLLTSPGYRVIVPYLCGYGTTAFLSADTARNGQQAALAVDVIALMDALGIPQPQESPGAFAEAVIDVTTA